MMSDSKLTDVHLIERLPEASSTGAPILFVHGAFAGAWCWDEHFMPYFAQRGHVARAVDLPGRRGRPDFAHLQDFALSDYLEAVLIAIDQFDQPPVLVGHSMGGQLAWRASEERDVAGLVLMASVPPTGLAAPAMELLVSRPSLFWDVAAIHAGEAGSIESVQAALFSDTTDKALVEKYAARMQHESQAAVAGLYLPFMPNILSIWGTPIFVQGAEKDSLIPPAHVHWTASLAGKLAKIYNGIGHGMMLEDGWQSVADDILAWCVDNDLSEQAV
jgi:pimeloyl-ACP methyl ester carboxylesterase